MDLLERLLNEHTQLLKNRGYDAESLKNGFLKEDLYTDLKRNLSAVIFDLDFESQMGFSLNTKGLFNNNRVTVHFRLYYRTDPGALNVDLYRLEVSHEQFTKEFDLKTSYDLPHAQKAFEMLKKRSGID